MMDKIADFHGALYLGSIFLLGPPDR